MTLSRLIYFIPPVIFALMIGMMFWGLQRDNPDDLPSTLIGRMAPALDLPALGDLPTITPAALMRDEIKIVNYWASWCVPCRVEHPNIQALADQGLAVYGVNFKDSPQPAQNFLAELGNPYRAVGVDAGRTGIEWGVYGVPETYVIDQSGKIAYRHAGPVTGRVMQETILPLIAQLQQK